MNGLGEEAIYVNARVARLRLLPMTVPKVRVGLKLLDFIVSRKPQNTVSSVGLE